MELELGFGGTRMRDAAIRCHCNGNGFDSTSCIIPRFQLLSCIKRQSWDRCCSNISKVPSFPSALVGLQVKCKWLSMRLSPAGKTSPTHTGPIQIGPSRAWRVIHLFVVDLCRSLDVIGDHDAQTTSRLAERIDPS